MLRSPEDTAHLVGPRDAEHAHQDAMLSSLLLTIKLCQIYEQEVSSLGYKRGEMGLGLTSRERVYSDLLILIWRKNDRCYDEDTSSSCRGQLH